MRNILLIMISWLCLGAALQAQTVPQNPSKIKKHKTKQITNHKEEKESIAEQIIAKHIQAMGFQKTEQHQSYTIYGKQNLMGLNVLYKEYYKYPNLKRSEMQALGEKNIVVQNTSDGNGWKIVPIQGIKVPQKLTIQDINIIADDQIIYSYLIDYQKKKAKVNLLSPEIIDSTVHFKIALVFPDSTRFIYLINSQTYLLTKQIGKFSAGESVAEYSDYREINAHWIPFKKDFKSVGYKLITKLDSVIIGDVVDDSLFTDQTQNKNIVKMHDEAVELAFGSDADSTIIKLYNKGTIALRNAQYGAAENYFLQARKKLENKNQEDSYLLCAMINFSLANIYELLGQYKDAEFYHIAVLEMNEKVQGKENINYSISLNELGNYYEKRGDYLKANSMFLESKKIVEKIYGKNSVLYANILADLAGIKMKQGQFQESEKLFVEAMHIIEKNIGKYNVNYSFTCSMLANLYIKNDNYDKGEELFTESLEIESKILSKNNLSYALTLDNFADLYVKKNKFEQAFKFYKESSEIITYHIENNFNYLSEREKEIFWLDDKKDAFDFYNSFTLNTHQQIPALTGWLYDNTLVIKGLLLQSTQKIRQNILQSGDTSLIRLFEDWKAQREYLAKVSTLTLAEKQKREIDEKKLETEANDLEKRLSLQVSKLEDFENLEGLGGDKTRYTWQDIQKALKPNEAAIEIIRTRYYDKKWTDSVLYIALIVRPETKVQPDMLVLPNGNAMESTYFKRYKNFVNFQRTDTSSYQAYWGTIAQYLQKNKIRKAYISPDGIYNLINLNVLQNPRSKQFVLEEIDIELMTNTKDLAQRQKNLLVSKPVTNKKEIIHTSLLVGRPSYRIDPNRQITLAKAYQRGIEDNVNPTNYHEQEWKDLPATETEVLNIQKLLQAQNLPVKALLKEEALEEAIKKADNPKILHIATHGFFLTAEIDTLKKETDYSKALLRSGIVLAGVNNQIADSLNIENGVLTSYEAMNLNLDRTDLVVLSACETGLGEVSNGEGVYGLQRALKVAGAKAILMSLWTVNDKATQELMTLFYENWLAKKQSKRDAFKNAQLTLKQKYNSPYYWGAFVMVGE